MFIPAAAAAWECECNTVSEVAWQPEWRGRRTGTKDTVCTQWTCEVLVITLELLSYLLSLLFTRGTWNRGGLEKKHTLTHPCCRLSKHPGLFVEKHLHWKDQAEEVEEDGCRIEASGVSRDTLVCCCFINTIKIAFFIVCIICANHTRQHIQLF